MERPEAGQRKRQVAGVFDRAASSYDDVAGSYFSVLGPRLVDKTDIPLGATVVDVACGKGATLLPAAQRVGAAGIVIGVDLSMEMVRSARAKVSGQGLANANVAVMDGEALALQDACADVAICGFSLHFFPDPIRAIRELARVLVANGGVAISEWGPTDERWAWEDELIGALPVKGVGAGSFDTPAALEQALAAAGLQQIEVTTESLTVSLSDAEEWWRWKWSYSFRHVLEHLDPRVRETFKRDAFEHLQTMRDDAGIVLPLHALMAVARKG